MGSVLGTTVRFMADTSGAITVMHAYVAPTIRTLAALAAIVCTFFLVNAGYLYMTSSGRPQQLEHAKHVLRNALIGLVIVLSAATLTSILSNAYGTPHSADSTTLPSLQAIPPEHVSNGLVDVLIKAVTGFLNNIIQAVATPFLAALAYFTQGTPLMAQNSSVFNLWLAIVGITDVLFVVILALLGFHIMSAASFGFDEIEIKHMLPRIGLVFLLINTSIFFIDAVIQLSNVLINAIGKVSGAGSVWEILTSVVKEAGGQGLAALLMMLAFLIFSVILLVYYVGRLVTLFIGAVLSPLVALIWLLPGFRDFSESAIKTYLSTIFVLFVHVVILQLAASLFTGLSATDGNHIPDTLMSMVIGLATVMALLKTQSVMMQFSYVSMGARNARKLGGQFMNGVSYMTSNQAGMAKSAISRSASGSGRLVAGSAPTKTVVGHSAASAINHSRQKQPNVGVKTVIYRDDMPPNKTKTGTTYEAPKIGIIDPTKEKKS